MIISIKNDRMEKNRWPKKKYYLAEKIASRKNRWQKISFFIKKYFLAEKIVGRIYHFCIKKILAEKIYFDLKYLDRQNYLWDKKY